MFSRFSWKRPELAIDFGTANLRVVVRDEGLVFEEPALCCFGELEQYPRLVAAGAAAEAMLDRTPAHLKIQRPMFRGVLQDIDSATLLLRYAVERARRGYRRGSVRAAIGVPADATQAERRALLTAAREAGLKGVTLVSEPFAAAIGAQLPVEEPKGTLVVECGAGTTEVAVVSLGGICHTRTVRGGGAAFDHAIADHLHLKHKFLIGERTAEQVKLAYAERRGNKSSGHGSLAVKGRSLVSAGPASMELTLEEIDKVADKQFAEIVTAVRDVLSETSPELSKDICDRGIVLTGGGALTPRLRDMIEAGAGVPVTVAQDAARCVANGLHRMMLN